MFAGEVDRVLTSSDLTGHSWSFGPILGNALTQSFVFGRDGLIKDYEHPNEHRWGLKGDRLEIYRDDGGLMWHSDRVAVLAGDLYISLRNPDHPDTTFGLVQLEPLEAPASPEAQTLAVAAPKPPEAAAVPATRIGTSDFLFPRDLRLTDTKLGRVLLVGSCLTALYHEQFQLLYPGVGFDYIAFNYAGSLPAEPPRPLDGYDLQYVQIPLRSVITDRVVWATQFNDPAFADAILNDAYDIIDAMLDSALSYNRSHGILTLVSNFFVPQMTAPASLAARGTQADIPQIVRKLNEYLAKSLGGRRNVFLADVNALADSVGKRYILDDLIYFNSHGAVFFHDWGDYDHSLRIDPVPPIGEIYESKREEFLQAAFAQIEATWRTVRQIDQVKAVVFDLDNTLWRGQIAEHYRPDSDALPRTDGWPNGLWETVHQLRARGILVAICSKNDEAKVRESWSRVVQPSFLKLEDFASVKINWQDKAGNIEQICREFNIKPKSVVFVDDNAVERSSVAAALPGIRTIGANPYLTRRILLWAPETQVATLTDESAQREDMIRKQIVREESRSVLSREEFLATLKTEVTFFALGGPEQPEFARVLELINKTNQFNTTGKRWAGSETAAFLGGGGRILAFRVKDKFADYGIVGAIMLSQAEIAQMVMSCRVMGMEVESYAIARAVELVRDALGDVEVRGTIRLTPDNGPCQDVFARAGFEPTVQDGVSALARQRQPAKPRHITGVFA